MSDGKPDLVQRAAARLGKATAGPLGPARAELRPETSSLADAQPASVGPMRQSGPTSPYRNVTISPTSLAAAGISLPVAGPSRTIEEFRSIKRQLLTPAVRAHATPGTGGRVILVTSARPGDGKTFVATNLALSLAYEKDSRVLLLDADAYRQSLLTVLGITADEGWLDLLSNGSLRSSQVILQTNIPNLTVLPAGKKRAEIPELMSSQSMKHLLDELQREDTGRYIIIDSLPCMTSTEPSILASLAGQTVFVVAAYQTDRSEVNSSLRLLSSSPSVKLVLNKADPLLTEQFKGYGYAYGY